MRASDRGYPIHTDLIGNVNYAPPMAYHTASMGIAYNQGLTGLYFGLSPLYQGSKNACLYRINGINQASDINIILYTIELYYSK